MTTGERIHNCRIAAGLTQEELAKRVGLQKAAIYKYEKGLVVNLKRDIIEKLSVALNVTPTYLLGLSSNTPPSSSLPSAQLVKNLSLDQLKALAADEKFALYNGDDSNAITRDVLEIAALHAIKNGKPIPAEEPPQEDSLTREIIDVVRSLPPDQQQEALNYVQYLSDRAHK